MVGWAIGISCSGSDTGSGPARVTAVDVTPSTTSMVAGTTREFAVEPRDASGALITGRTVTWTVSDDAMLAVANGTVTAKEPGDASVYATVDGIRGEARITVTPAPVASLTLTAPLPEVPVGGTLQLTATPRSAQGTVLVDRAVTYSSSDDAIATVGGDGTLTAHLTGSATISAVSEGRAASLDVRVVNRPGPTGPPAQLAFQVQPQDGEGQRSLPAIRVSVHDGVGNLVADAATPVTLTLPVNPMNDPLRGTITVSPVNGVATFSDLSLAHPQTGLVFEASASGLQSARSRPFTVGLTFRQVTAGTTHTCGVTIVDAAYCWGRNDWGELGDGTRLPRFVPAPVADGLRFSQVTAGSNFTCGLTIDGHAHCWGLPLGPWSSEDESPTPVAVPGGLAFTQIDAGGLHVCAVTGEGAAYCWGYGENGSLGDGLTDRTRPGPAAVEGELRFREVSAGYEHSCGVTLSDAAYCWGVNISGRLGDGTQTPRLTPAAVVGEHSFKRIIAGKQHTCALTSAGVAYCWAMHVGEPGEPTRGLVPGLVATALRFDALTAGSEYTCGISGTLGYCWGENRHGRFGNGTDVLLSVTPRSLAGAHPFAQLSAGETHACGVTPEGTVYCWGSNLLGQLGVGIQSTGSNVPTRVHH